MRTEADGRPGISYSHADGFKAEWTGDKVPKSAVLGIGDRTGRILFAEAIPLPAFVDGPPPAPTGLEATAGEERVDLRWNAEDSATGYKVQWATVAQDFSAARQTETSDTSRRLTGLRGGTTYKFRVLAVNAVGDSDPSNEVQATPTARVLNIPARYAAPSAATNFSISRGVSSSTIPWRDGSTSGMRMPGNTDGATNVIVAFQRGTSGTVYYMAAAVADAPALYIPDALVTGGENYRIRAKVISGEPDYAGSPDAAGSDLLQGPASTAWVATSESLLLGITGTRIATDGDWSGWSNEYTVPR